MSRASIRFWEWVTGLVLIGLGCLFLREMGVKIPPEIMDKITQVIALIQR
jgi:hypothetical protein